MLELPFFPPQRRKKSLMLSQDRKRLNISTLHGNP